MSINYSDAILTIDLGAIAHNYNYFREISFPAECGAVVKANAYGLGMKEVSERLYQFGCRKFFAATLDEALQLRNILPDRNIDIFVFHGVRNGQEKEFTYNHLIPVLNHEEELIIWSHHAHKEGHKLSAILHFDTGMNRLGFPTNKIDSVIKKTSALELKYIMSHLACAEQPDNQKNSAQLDKFNKILSYFPSIPASLANSPGCMLSKNYHFDLVRPGAGLFGVNTILGVTGTGNLGNSELHNVVTLTAKIIQLREIDTRQAVGYGAAAEVEKGSTLAVVPVGYADGYLRSLSRKAMACVRGVMAPVIGRISMDMIILDVTEVKMRNPELNIGTEAEIIGENCPVDMLANWGGTIGYEILTSLGSRYRRVYK